MIKKICDVCGKEIIKENEVWTNILTAQEGNSRVSFDETIIDMCEACATHIHCVTSMMKQGWKADFGQENSLTADEYNKVIVPKIDTVSVFINALESAMKKTEDFDNAMMQLKCIGWSEDCKNTIETALECYQERMKKRLN